ncbi:MAG: AAA family ATPase [Vibrio sp.]
MSITHAKDLLELPSQKQLLSQMYAATQSNSNLVHIQGELGSGKTSIAQKYISAWNEEQTIAAITCTPAQTLAEQRRLILTQLMAQAEEVDELEPPFDEMQPLTETLLPAMQDQSYDLVFILDDAQDVNPELLDELYALVLVGQENPSWKINILAFALPHQLEVADLPVSLSLDIQDLHVSPFNDAEVEHFVNHVVLARIRDEKQRKRILKRAYQIEPYPSELLGLSLQDNKWYSNINWKLAGYVGGGTLALVLLLSWWQSGPDTEELKKRPEWRLTVDEKQKLEEQEALEGQLAGVANDAELLPAPVTDQTTTVGDNSDDERHRVVVPSDVVDSIEEQDNDQTASVDNAEQERLEQERAEAERKAQEKARAEAQAKANAQAKAKAEAQAKAKAEAQAKKEAEEQRLEAEKQKALAAAKSTSSYADENNLMKLPASRYTLQLAAVSSLQSAMGFVDKHQIKNQARIYKTTRNGKAIYVVTYQDFASADQARAMASVLPKGLKSLKPWPKSIGQIQQEIKQN